MDSSEELVASVDDVTLCNNCGARVSGLLCAYCGAPSDVLSGNDNAELQMKALQEYHAHLQEISDIKQRIRMLSSGYMPTQKSCVIEAGLRCYPLIRDGSGDPVSAAAALRMESAISRLKFLATQADDNKVIEEFETRLKRYRKAEQKLTRYTFAILAVFFGLLIWGIVVLIKRC